MQALFLLSRRGNIPRLWGDIPPEGFLVLLSDKDREGMESRKKK
jgi:hypothetical protein